MQTSLLALFVLAGCAIRGSVGVGASGPTKSGTCAGCSAGLAAPSVSADTEIGAKLDENFSLGLYQNLTLRNWEITGDAYRAITNWAKTGETTCCGAYNPLTTMGKYIAVFFGYAGAWLLATNVFMLGPAITWRANERGPSGFASFGVGPALYLDEKRSFADTFGPALTLAGGYDFAGNLGLQARVIGDPVESRWIAVSVGLTLYH